MKSKPAWAIMENGNLILVDERWPVFWLKTVAERARKEWGLEDAEVVRVDKVKPARRKRREVNR